VKWLLQHRKGSVAVKHPVPHRWRYRHAGCPKQTRGRTGARCGPAERESSAVSGLPPTTDIRQRVPHAKAERRILRPCLIEPEASRAAHLRHSRWP
jgi:hypothetical protein